MQDILNAFYDRKVIMLKWIKQTFKALFSASEAKEVENFDKVYNEIRDINDFHSLKPKQVDGDQEMLDILGRMDGAGE